MALSEDVAKLNQLIKKAIDDHELTQTELDMIINLSAEDGHIDPQERALLKELNAMIENGSVKLVP